MIMLPIRLVHLLLIGLMGLTVASCSSLENQQKYNYQVISNNTLTGQKLQRLLSAQSHTKRPTVAITISNESLSQRTFGVDDKGQPNRFLRELKIRMQVDRNGTIIARESLFSSAEVKPNNQSTFQQKKFKETLSSDLAQHAYDRIQAILQP